MPTEKALCKYLHLFILNVALLCREFQRPKREKERATRNILHYSRRNRYARNRVMLNYKANCIFISKNGKTSPCLVWGWGRSDTKERLGQLYFHTYLGKAKTLCQYRDEVPISEEIGKVAGVACARDDRFPSPSTIASHRAK